MGGGRGESEERSEVQAMSSLTSTAPKARSKSRGVATLDEAPRNSLRVSSKQDQLLHVIHHSLTPPPLVVTPEAQVKTPSVPRRGA